MNERDCLRRKAGRRRRWIIAGFCCRDVMRWGASLRRSDRPSFLVRLPFAAKFCLLEDRSRGPDEKRAHCELPGRFFVGAVSLDPLPPSRCAEGPPQPTNRAAYESADGRTQYSNQIDEPEGSRSGRRRNEQSECCRTAHDEQANGQRNEEVTTPDGRFGSEFWLVNHATEGIAQGNGPDTSNPVFRSYS